jgi:hypothetical protein
VSDEESFSEPVPPPPTWIDQRLAEAGTPRPMTSDDYAHLMVVEDEPRKGGKKVSKHTVVERLPPDAAQYLGALRALPAPHLAATAANVSMKKVSSWRKNIVGFREVENEAFRDASDALLASAYARAVHGVLKPVYQQGHLVGFVREYSDKLAEVLLKGMKRDMFAPEPEKGSTTNNTIIINDPKLIGDMVRNYSPTSQPKVIEAQVVEMGKA